MTVVTTSSPALYNTPRTQHITITTRHADNSHWSQRHIWESHAKVTWLYRVPHDTLESRSTKVVC